jgi:hypothetical protein
MELGTRELVNFCLLVATIAGSFQVVKSQLNRLMKDFEKALSEIQSMNERLDKQEADSAVVHHQTRILAGILSPSNLKEQTQEIADLKARVEINTRDVESLYRMHNGNHPTIVD